MKRKLILGTVLILCITSFIKIYYFWGRTIDIDTTKENITTITSNKTYISSLIIYLKTNTNNNGTLQLLTPGNRRIYKSINISGKNKIYLHDGDWYDHKAHLKYIPSDSRSGKLTIQYKFN